MTDVGRDTYEEINHQSAAAEGGKNYGWNYYEGPKKYKDDRLEGSQEAEGPDAAVHAYKHTDDVCAAVGGFVYRGQARSKVSTARTSGRTSAAAGSMRSGSTPTGRGASSSTTGDLDVVRVSSFGQDAEGELYVLALTEGVVYKVVSG